MRFIVAEAARIDAEGTTAYKAWPGMGYNARIPAALRSRLPEGLARARTILDLYATAEGKQWWAQHGTLTRMYFDLRPGSRSRKALSAALTRKGIKWSDI